MAVTQIINQQALVNGIRQRLCPLPLPPIVYVDRESYIDRFTQQNFASVSFYALGRFGGQNANIQAVPISPDMGDPTFARLDTDSTGINTYQTIVGYLGGNLVHKDEDSSNFIRFSVVGSSLALAVPPPTVEVVIDGNGGDGWKVALPRSLRLAKLLGIEIIDTQRISIIKSILADPDKLEVIAAAENPVRAITDLGISRSDTAEDVINRIFSAPDRGNLLRNG